MNNEINNDVSKSRGKYLYNMRRKFLISFLVCFAIFIFVFIGIALLNRPVDNNYVKVIIQIIMLGSMIIGIPSLILFIICAIMASRYCPYCYTKGFTTTTLNTTKIRSYVKKEKYNDSNGREKIKRVLYEDWEGEYRNECCGTKYHKTWQNKIDLG